MLKANGYDDAIIGPALIWHNNTRVEVLVYDAELIRNKLVSEGMSGEEAREFIEFNIEGAYMGPDTPIFVWPQDEWDATA